jgi:hypothetical protein
VSSCLEPDQVIAFVRGRGTDGERGSAEDHIDTCAECRQLVAAAAAAEYDGADAAAAPVPPRGDELRGTVIGRYTIGDRLGAGGMGVVYLAEDRQLRRRVVIKLIRPDLERAGDIAGAHARLLREAQAMAQLSHPNVVHVYDIGSFDDAVYVAMEYLDGGDLRAWLAARPRPTREIVDVFVQVARGLAAAHAVGIVHRDIKPANVVVSAGGQVKITDFGLARGLDDRHGAPEPLPADARPALDPSITRTGVSVGTPAYMSPEQAAGRDVDARTDQYSFCVALYEALEGTRPTLVDGNPAEAVRAPAAVRAALRKGLSVAPADRFASMDALIAALVPRRRGTRVAIGVAALVLAGVGVAAWLETRSARAADPCAAEDAPIAAAWSAERRVRLAAVFAGEPNATTWTSQVAPAIDDHVRHWRALRRTTCVAAADRRVAPDAPRDPQMACLDRRARELAGVLDHVLLMSRDELVAVPGLLARVDQLWLCAGPATLAAEPIAPPAELTDRLLALRARISGAPDAASALADAGAIVATARELRYPPIEAEALAHLGHIQLVAGATAEAAVTLEQAVERALAGNAVLTRAIALVDLVRANRARSRWADAERWGRLAQLAVRRQQSGLPLARELAGELTAVRAALTPAAPVRATCDPPDGLRVHLALDDGHGDRARDSSGLGNHGIVNAVDGAKWVDGRVGGAADFDGYNDGIDLGSQPAIDDLPAISMCAWILPRSYPSSYPSIADKSADTYEGGWNFYIQTDGTIGFLTSYRDWAEGGLIRLGAWLHACVTWDGTVGPDGVALFQDAARVEARDKGTNREGAAVDDAAAPRDRDADRNLVIGRVNNGKYNFDGRIDDYQLYDRALDWTEVMAIHDCAFVAP